MLVEAIFEIETYNTTFDIWCESIACHLFLFTSSRNVCVNIYSILPEPQGRYLKCKGKYLAVLGEIVLKIEMQYGI